MECLLSEPDAYRRQESMTMNQIQIVSANIVTAFSAAAVGTKVTHAVDFLSVAAKAIEAFDFASQRVPGQGFIMCPEAIPFVSAGVGPRSADAADYVVRTHRGEAQMFLKREKAAPVEGCALIVYTREAYLADPDVAGDAAEVARIQGLNPRFVLIAVLAFAGPKAPLTPSRLVHNLAGGNKEALVWTADEIRAKAKESLDYDRSWAVVAD